MAWWALAVVGAAVLAGCVAPGAVPEDPGLEPLAAPVEDPGWVGTPRRIEVPPGESFGLALLHLEPEEALSTSFGTAYGFAVDTEELGEDSFLHFAVYEAKAGEAEWRISATGPGGGRVGLGLDADGPLDMLVVFAAHSPDGGSLRALAEFTTDFPERTVAGAWPIAGPASVSYYTKGGLGDPLRPARSNGMEVSSLTGDPALLTGPLLALRSAHGGGVPAIASSVSVVLPRIGAGLVDITWSAEGEDQRAVAPFAGPVQAATQVGKASGDTALSLELSGAMAMPSTLTVAHVTVPFDLASLDLALAPVFLASGVELRGGGWVCATAGPGAACFP